MNVSALPLTRDGAPMVSRKSDSIPMAAVLDFETAKTRLDEFQVERGNFDQLFARVRETSG